MSWLINDLLNCAFNVPPRLVYEIWHWAVSPPRRPFNGGYRKQHIAPTTPHVSPRSNHSAWVCVRDEVSAAAENLADISVWGGRVRNGEGSLGSIGSLFSCSGIHHLSAHAILKKCTGTAPSLSSRQVWGIRAIWQGGLTFSDPLFFFCLMPSLLHPFPHLLLSRFHAAATSAMKTCLISATDEWPSVPTQKRSAQDGRGWRFVWHAGNETHQHGPPPWSLNLLETLKCMRGGYWLIYCVTK